MNEEDLVEKMADAIRAAAVDGVRQRVKLVDLPLRHFHDVFSEALAETDRSTSVLIGALVDDLLLWALKRELVGLNKSLNESLFGSNGPLSTLRNRINLLLALGWISPKTTENIDLIRKIRNEFAHRSTCRTFDDQKIAGLVSSMGGFNQAFEAGQLELKALNYRQRFLMYAAVSASSLLKESVEAPLAMKSAVPVQLVATEFDDLPKNLMSLNVLAAHIMLQVRDSSGQTAERQRLVDWPDDDFQLPDEVVQRFTRKDGMEGQAALADTAPASPPQP